MRKRLLTLIGLIALATSVVVPYIHKTPLEQFFSGTSQDYPAYEDRAALAAEFGIFGYESSREQNNLLAERLQDFYAVPTLDGEPLVGYSVVSRYKTTLASSMTSSQTTVPTASVTTFDGHTLTMSDLGSKVFLVLEPGTSREEIVVCTAISSTSWTSCTRGLAFYGTTETEVSANKKAHNAGSVVVMSNTHYVYEQVVDKDAAETIAGLKTFTTIPRAPTSTPTNDQELITLYQFQQATSTGGVIASETQKGTVEIGTDSEVVAGTDTGSSLAQLVIKPSQYITNKAYHWNTAVAFGETITAGQILTVSSTNGRYYKADADVLADAQAVLVMAYEDGVAGEYKKVLFPGSVIYSLTSLTTSSPYYLSNTAGGVSTGTGTNTRQVGYAMSTNAFMFYPIPVQATATPTANALVQSDSNGRIVDWIGKSSTAGETIVATTTPVPVYISDGTNGRVAGSFYKSDANDTTNLATNFQGFIRTNVTSGTTAIIYDSGVVAGFAGLSPGEKYYVSDTVGTVSSTSGTVVIPVGVAISATEILIQKEKRFMMATSTFSSTGSQAVTGVGGRPEIIKITATNGNSTLGSISYGVATSVANQSVHLYSHNTANTGAGDDSNFAGQSTSYVISMFSDTSSGNGSHATITSIDNNGFTLNWTQGGAGAGTIIFTYEVWF